MSKYKELEFKKITRSFFGNSVLSTDGALLIFCIIITFAWLPDGLGALLDKIFSGKICEWSFNDGTMVLQIFVPVLIFFYIKHVAKKHVLSVDIEINDSPNKSKALILFLSPNDKNCENISSIEDFNKEEYGRNNYKMPVLAIDYHKDELEKIIIICSNDSKKNESKFSGLVKNIFGEEIFKFLEFKYLEDFEKAKDVYDCLELIYKNLKKKNIRENDVIIDVTGGQKIVAIAGALFAIPNDRLLQYVSTSDSKVRNYNLIYGKEDE